MTRISLELDRDYLQDVLETLYEIPFEEPRVHDSEPSYARPRGIEELITEIEDILAREEDSCYTCHYNIDNNCPIKDAARDIVYGCANFVFGKEL